MDMETIHMYEIRSLMKVSLVRMVRYCRLVLSIKKYSVIHIGGHRPDSQARIISMMYN
jgi:hypothetical protein